MVVLLNFVNPVNTSPFDSFDNLPLHMLIGPPGSPASQEPMLDAQRVIAESQRSVYRAVFEGDPKGGGTQTGIREDHVPKGKL